MTLRERIRAIAEEYQRAPRWIRTQEVGKMLDEWLDQEPDVALLETFTKAAAKHATMEDEWNAMVDAWDALPEATQRELLA